MSSESAIKQVSDVSTDSWIGSGSVRVRIREFSPVAISTHLGETTICSICRSELLGPSPNNKESDPDDERIARGACNHSFHYECINRLQVAKKNACSCPNCGLPWQYDNKVIGQSSIANFLTRKKATGTTGVPVASK